MGQVFQEEVHEEDYGDLHDFQGERQIKNCDPVSWRHLVGLLFLAQPLFSCLLI